MFSQLVYRCLLFIRLGCVSCSGDQIEIYLCLGGLKYIPDKLLCSPPTRTGDDNTPYSRRLRGEKEVNIVNVIVKNTLGN